MSGIKPQPRRTRYSQVNLFTGLFLIAIVPGPLSVVAFNGGTESARSFLIGLAGQLVGLLIMTNLLTLLGGRVDLINNQWLMPVAAGMLIILGIRAMFGTGKSKKAPHLTFIATFSMAFSNPKAIFGFVPQLMLFQSTTSSRAISLWTNSSLVVAVSLSMCFYFLLGR